MAAVGHVYLLPIVPGSVSERHSWVLSKRPSGGYVFYSDFDGGSWLRYRAEDGLLASLPGEAEATVWAIDPKPDPALLIGQPPAPPLPPVVADRTIYRIRHLHDGRAWKINGGRINPGVILVLSYG